MRLSFARTTRHDLRAHRLPRQAALLPAERPPASGMTPTPNPHLPSPMMMNRPHRQALATMALFVATVLPTGYVGLTAWRIGRPGHLREVEAEIGRRLGLHATLE